MTGIKVLSVASEIYPLVKTGGLADVVGALPLALRKHGVETVTLVPGYPAVKAALGQTKEILAVDELFGGAARVLAAHAGGLDLLVLDAPHLFDRPGNPYVGSDGRDWPDNAFRFGALGWIAARLGRGDAAGFVPDILHGHDWQAGLAMAYLAYGDGRRPATVLTVHNLAYQGQFPADLLGPLRLPPHAYAIEGVEHYGAIGFLKAGLQFADRITTVSPTYARGNPDAGLRLRPRRAAARPCRRVVRHPQRHRCRRLESGNRHADRRRVSALRRCRHGRPTRRRCSGDSRWRRIPNACCSAS